MESRVVYRPSEEHPMIWRPLHGDRRFARRGERGIALVMALIVTLIAFLIVGTTLYMVTQSMTMSGAGKAYASAEEAGDGAVEATKEYINLVNNADTLPSLYSGTSCVGAGETYFISDAITGGLPCHAALNLPGMTGTVYRAEVFIQRLFTARPAGGRIVFAELATAANKPSVFYRITTQVMNQYTGTMAENSAVYRFVPR